MSLGKSEATMVLECWSWGLCLSQEAKGCSLSGFPKMYEEKGEDEEEVDLLPEMKKGETLSLIDTVLEQRFTNPPPRYSEASLIRTLEMKGIGRPSTYATIVGLTCSREYVKKEKGRLAPTSLGRTVNKVMMEFFP